MALVALMPGVECLAIDSAAAVPSDGTISKSMAVPPDAVGRSISVAIRPVGTYATLSISIQVSNTNVAANYQEVDTSTVVGGELIIYWPIKACFMRIVMTSSTGASRTGMVIGVLA